MSVRTQAFVNFYAAIGTLEKFVELDQTAKKLAEAQDLTIRFDVKNTLDGLVIFKGGKVKVIPYDQRSVDIHLICRNAEHFNAVVAGTGMPLPIKGLFKTLSFMGKPTSPFNALTNEMSSVMRTQKYLDGKAAPELSTILAFYAMSAAIAEIGNEDEIGKIAGARVPDGEISLQIAGIAETTIIKKDGRLTCVRAAAKDPRAFMVFDNLATAGGIITGELDSMSCIAGGRLVTKGFMPMLDNLNKVLNLVPKYLS